MQSRLQCLQQIELLKSKEEVNHYFESFISPSVLGIFKITVNLLIIKSYKIELTCEYQKRKLVHFKTHCFTIPHFLMSFSK